MNTICRLSCVLAAASFISFGAPAQNPPEKNGATAKAPAAPAKPAPTLVIYRAAPGAAPAARGTGGSRGSGDAAVRLDVLAPDETGLTTEEQPSLFWYQ